MRTTVRVGQVVVESDGTALIVGRRAGATGAPDHRYMRDMATGRLLKVLLSDEYVRTLASKSQQ